MRLDKDIESFNYSLQCGYDHVRKQLSGFVYRTLLFVRDKTTASLTYVHCSEVDTDIRFRYLERTYFPEMASKDETKRGR